MSFDPLSLLMGLVLAHLVGDFLLQPSAWVAERYRLRHRSKHLLQHAGLHGLLTGVCCWRRVPSSPGDWPRWRSVAWRWPPATG